MPTLPTTAHLQFQTSKILVTTHIYHHLAHPKSFISNPLKKSISIKKPSTCLVPHGAKSSSGPGGIDFRKIERVIRLHSAIKNRRIKELLDLAADECRDYLDILLTIDPVELSQKVLDVFYAFLLSNRIQLVIKPAKDVGVDIGIKCCLEWPESRLPLLPGCSLYSSHIYHGMVFVRKETNILGSLHHRMELLGPKLEKIFLPMIDKIVPSGVLEGKSRVAFLYCLLSLVFMVVFLVFFKNTFV
ncbi:uncharacterized protein LOC103711365 [Phoenix dactylifera]|uniref:Uncharacterized protein LOC103711365 n=1 Tax=Phoenix dactylifera TaxID=42345 RepID=A0A8B9ACA8_PHODC|nr:uncharacterized protein LOC103711365 [Phoenix dactylifera]